MVDQHRTTRDILGYLCVLNDPVVLGMLSEAERATGRDSIMGCLSRLTDVMCGEPQASEALDAIKHRERLNGIHPVGHPMLVQATNHCALEVYHYYRKRQGQS